MAITLQKCTLKNRIAQIVCKRFGQVSHLRLDMIVTDMLARSLPYVLLWIQVRCSRWKPQKFKTRVGGQEIPYGRPAMPGRSIPEQQDWLVRNRIRDLFQIRRGCDRIHDLSLHHDFLTREHIQAAIEVDFLPTGVNPNRRCLPNRCPNAHRRRLQIQNDFIDGENDRFRCILLDIDQFFSSLSSKSAT